MNSPRSIAFFSSLPHTAGLLHRLVCIFSWWIDKWLIIITKADYRRFFLSSPLHSFALHGDRMSKNVRAINKWINNSMSHPSHRIIWPGCDHNSAFVGSGVLKEKCYNHLVCRRMRQKLYTFWFCASGTRIRIRESIVSGSGSHRRRRRDDK